MSPTPNAAIKRPAERVLAGIFLSRIIGLVRERVFGYYFGVTAEADAFRAAFRIPNLLQNLFGEGVLSASFIPVYKSLVAADDREEATRVAGAVFSILALVVSTLVLVGVLAAPWLVDLIAAGFPPTTRDLTVTLVRVLFPGAGLLVLSAWCLGILNSHDRFFLSYVSPVVWNVAMIVALVLFAPRSDLPSLAVWLAWGSVVGSALQMLVQLPVVLRVIGRLRIGVASRSAHVHEIVRNFGPVFVGRGVVQISSYVDAWIASFLITGSVAALTYAQTLAVLPVSLFGMSVSASELPAMSALQGDTEALRSRLLNGLRKIAFWIIPSAVAFFAIGDIVAGVVYQSGQFDRATAEWVWLILAGSAVGLLATTLGRLYSSTLYALRDTKTPFRFALVRVTLTISLGYSLAMPIRVALGLPPRWGAAGIAVASSIAGWVEFVLLRRAVHQRVGDSSVGFRRLAALWGAAALAAGAAWAVRTFLPVSGPLVGGGIIIAVFGIVYFAAVSVFGVDEHSPIKRLRRR